MRCLIATISLVLISGVACAKDDVVCAAVVPCSSESNWEVAPPFNAGACAALYEQVCQNQKTMDLSVSLNECSVSTSSLQGQVRRLKAQVRRMKRRRK